MTVYEAQTLDGLTRLTMEVDDPYSVPYNFKSDNPSLVEYAETLALRGVNALLFGTAPKGAKLVHGHHRRAKGDTMGFLAVDRARMVETVRWQDLGASDAKIYDEKEWVEFASAKVERVYSKKQAAILCVSRKHFGRWHNSKYP